MNNIDEINSLCNQSVCQVTTVENGDVYIGHSSNMLNTITKDPYVLIQQEINGLITPDLFFTKEQEKDFKKYLKENNLDQTFEMM